MKKEKIVTFVLILMMIFLVGAIFYFSYLLMEAPTEEKLTSAVAPKRTRAQVATSERFIALNQNNYLSPSPTSAFFNNSISPTPSLSILNPTQIPPESLVTKETPTPTEIILAKAKTPTPSSSNDYYLSPTEIISLPESGMFHSVIILIALAAFFIIYSLIF